MSRKVKLLWALLMVLLGIQFVPYKITDTAYDLKNDFITVESVPEEIADILHTSCYDCHSAQTKMPWYGSIAPVKWFVIHHVKEGREHVDFSRWSTYSAKEKSHVLDECYEMVGEGEMPLKSYLILHSDAKLNNNEREALNGYFLKKLRGMGNEIPEHEEHED
jgi:hypothetical protein